MYKINLLPLIEGNTHDFFLAAGGDFVYLLSRGQKLFISDRACTIIFDIIHFNLLFATPRELKRMKTSTLLPQF